MKLLGNIELPEGFEDAEDYRIDIDDEAMLFHEVRVFSTGPDFDIALSRLQLIFEQHYGQPKKTLAGSLGTAISCVLEITHGAQTITAQISGFGDHCGGYIRSANRWRWDTEPSGQS